MARVALWEQYGRESCGMTGQKYYRGVTIPICKGRQSRKRERMKNKLVRPETSDPLRYFQGAKRESQNELGKEEVRFFWKIWL